jgi:hypothetical protein
MFLPKGSCQEAGTRDIVTMDEADFSVYRLKGCKCFALVKWFG